MIGLKSTVQSSALPAQLVIVEGNIGVGKSTLACQLARQLNYKVFLEPTTKNPYLAKFYEDPKKYALKLQLWIFRQRFRTYIAATEHVLKSGRCLAVSLQELKKIFYKLQLTLSVHFKFYQNVNELSRHD